MSDKSLFIFQAVVIVVMTFLGMGMGYIMGRGDGRSAVYAEQRQEREKQEADRKQAERDARMAELLKALEGRPNGGLSQ